MAELVRADGMEVPPFEWPLLGLERCADAEAAALLAALISDMSEEEWSAAWLGDCAFYYWAGWYVHETHDLIELQRLHDACGGWLHWFEDESTGRVEKGPRFVPTAEWQSMFNEWASKRSPKPEAMIRG